MGTSLVSDIRTVLARRLVRVLLERHDGTVCVLADDHSASSLARLRATPGIDPGRVVAVVPPWSPSAEGGLDAAARAITEHGPVEHVFHFAESGARTRAPSRRPGTVGIRTSDVLALTKALGASRFHLVTSALVAGGAGRSVREDDGADWAPSVDGTIEGLRESERLVRAEPDLHWTISRPGLVLGGTDGEVDGTADLAGLFTFSRRLAELVPAWMPLPAPPLGTLNVVVADPVAEALEVIARRDECTGRTFHLTGEDVPVVDVVNEVAHLAGGPRLAWPFDPQTLAPLLSEERFPMIRFWQPFLVHASSMLESVGVAPAIAEVAVSRTSYDRTNAAAALGGAIERLDEPWRPLLPALWRRWQDDVDPREHTPALAEVVAGRIVLVTGASSGIGRALALELGAAGAHVLLAARTEEALHEVCDEIVGAGGRAEVHAVDLSSPEAAAALADEVVAVHGRVDILVNNAALSINRPIVIEMHRFRDFERTINLNYLSAVALTLGVLQSMRDAGDGHVVNVLSGAAQAPAPGFAAYGASKSALASFADVLRAELADDGIAVTNVFMGLVHTPMSDPTEEFRDMKALSPEEAAAIITHGIVTRAPSVAVEPMATMQHIVTAIWPTMGAALDRAGMRVLRRRYEAARRPDAAPG